MTDQVEAFNLIAKLTDDGNLEMVDALTNEIIYTEKASRGMEIIITKKSRLRRSEKTVAKTKMTSILECLIGVPEMENYL